MTFVDKLMDATDRVAEAFDRLLRLGRNGVSKRPKPERIIFHVVATRCEMDIGGFSSIYEQGLNRDEISTLIDGLNEIGENDLADEFRRGFELLKRDGYYEHTNWNSVSHSVISEIELIGRRVGDRLWNLDDKLADLLD